MPLLALVLLVGCSIFAGYTGGHTIPSVGLWEHPLVQVGRARVSLYFGDSRADADVEALGNMGAAIAGMVAA